MCRSPGSSALTRSVVLGIADAFWVSFSFGHTLIAEADALIEEGLVPFCEGTGVSCGADCIS